MNGEPDSALSIFNNIPVSSDSSITFLGAAAYAYSQKGDVEKVNDCLQNLEKENKSGNVHLINYSYSLIYRALKDSDSMFEYLKKSISEKVSTLVFIRVDPLWEDLKSNSTFKAIIENTFRKSDFKESLPPVLKKYEKSGLKEEEAKRLLKNLKEHMTNEMPYLENNLSLSMLAEQLNISANQLSQLLNEYLNKNFYDFINTYRLKEFKEGVKDPKNCHFTLLSIAYQCGFNSKTTFNTFFKKATGKTPSEYYKSL